MAIAEAVISSLIGVLTEELFSKLKEKVGLICGVDKELDNIKATFLMIRGVLADAEERQITSKAVKEWLTELKHVAYDTEDLLEEFECEVERQQFMEHDATKRRKLWSWLPKFSLSQAEFQQDMARKIKEINERVDRISEVGKRFHLTELMQIPDKVPRPPSTSVIKNSQSDFVGREDDKEQIIDLLLSDEDPSGEGKAVSVISIVGMGGLGKTTLAKVVYNDEDAQKHFQEKAWVCVSEVFDISRLTREIIESFTKRSCRLSNLDTMQCRLKEILTAKRFLIVLDDVWNTTQSALNELHPTFSYGAKGSKIIVTTREVAVSSAMGTDRSYRLELLSDDHCLSLLLRHAFVGVDRNAHPKLMEIGKELVKSHCHGLPLAAEVLGVFYLLKEIYSFGRTF